MAIETVTAKDAANATKNIAADLGADSNYYQVVKIGVGVDGATPTLVSTTNPMPVDIMHQPGGSPAAGTQVTVSTSAVQLLASNANRKGVIISVASGGPIRIGLSGVTNATGFVRATAGDVIMLPQPFCGTAVLQGIREATSSDAVVLVSEIV